jgi:hypothetical protein
MAAEGVGCGDINVNSGPGGLEELKPPQNEI